MRAPTLAALLLLAAGGCAGPAGPPRPVPEAERLGPEAKAAYGKALREFAAGDPVDADRYLGLALAVRPLHVPAHLFHQDIARARGAASRVAAEYERLAAELPGDADAAMLRVRASAVGGRERVTGYQAASMRNPAAPWPRIVLSVARAGLARTLEAEARDLRASGFPDRARDLETEAGRLAEGAKIEAERAVAMAPRIAAAHAALGDAEALLASRATTPQEGREALGRALGALAEARRLDPGDPRVLLEAAAVLRTSGDRAAAQDALDRAAASAPSDPRILAARARNLDDLGRAKEAVDAWKAAVATDPRDPDAIVDYGSALARAGRWEDALKQYRRADGIYAKAGRRDRWKARRGIATAQAQMGLSTLDAARLREAADEVRAYRREGGPDAGWADTLAEVLGIPAEEPARDPAR